ncbi:hypothetical protein BU26DRAFT_182490 [Trematosphaeria pertusa]|uniref:F-box domain-containing protein n=1 Tax=Trematosphaeria pertusa TaxID=390896 RepID=A0A6A6HT36_9PLEO|nr:uncharacterized protein BU26DRAFT_182490 [Trematosphaeria pertusa]KAF2241177.1 hypothetical protein BU26DRAFT_182490 [Trematosphaeria pertusa]
MELVLAFAYSGYHLWKHRRKSRIDVAEPYLLNIPAEIRLLVYDFLFDEQDETQSASTFLLPLLACRLIHHEACQRAFTRANFSLKIRNASSPYWSPAILKVPYRKLSCVRNITILWDSNMLETKDLRRFFYELECGPLNLDRLTFKITSPFSRAPFRAKYAPLFPAAQNFSKYVMEELRLLPNVDKVVVPNPSIEIKRNFQYLFDPEKPNLRFGGTPGNPTIEAVEKTLGVWKYTVVREGKDVRYWRLELTHPKADASGSEDEAADTTSG